MGFHETLSVEQKRRLEMSPTCCPANVNSEFGGYENKRGGSKVSREEQGRGRGRYCYLCRLHLALSLLPL